MTLYVNGEKIADTLIRAEIQRLRPHYERMITGDNPTQLQQQLYDWSRENVIERTVLRQAAMIEQEQIPADIIEQQYQLFLKNNTRPDSPEKTGDSITPDEQEIKKEIEQNLHVQKLLEKLNAAIPKPSEKEIASYYRDHADQFHLPEMVRVSHIVKHLNPGADTRKVYEQMEQVLLELKDNVDFADVARRWSDCPDNGGDLGYFLRGQMVPEFETVVFDLEPGQVSGIFQTSFGLHITKLWEKKPPGARPLKEVRQTIIDHLMQQDQKTALEDYLDLLKEKAVIEDK